MAFVTLIPTHGEKTCFMGGQVVRISTSCVR